MADKKDKAEAAPEGDVPAKSKKKMIMFIIIGVVVLVLVVGGVLGYMMMSKKSAADAEGEDGAEPTEEVAHKKDKGKKGDPPALPVFYKFDKPFTVRLAGAEGADAYLQLEAQFKLLDAHGVDAVKASEPELKHKITLLLLAKNSADLATAKGVETLAWEIRDAANHTMHPPKKKKGGGDDHAATAPSADVDPEAPVQAVLFTTFIIQ